MASTSCSRTTSSLLNLRRLRPSSSSPCRQPPGLRAPPGTPVHGATSLAASVTFTPPLHRRSMSSNTSRPSGALMDEPKREARFGLLKVFLTVITGLSIGAWISQKMAAFLEENELFVPEDEDDDDDDDD